MQFFKPAVNDTIQRAQARGKVLDFETLQPMVMSGKSVDLHGAKCLVHGRNCQLRSATMSISGVPCWDYSPQGRQEGLAGRTQPVQAVWAAIQRR
eukprot:3338817-Alexandrium_andersonii.AAC.1